MYVISMIAQPGMLDGMLVENISNAWGGGSEIGWPQMRRQNLR